MSKDTAPHRGGKPHAGPTSGNGNGRSPQKVNGVRPTPVDGVPVLTPDGAEHSSQSSTERSTRSPASAFVSALPRSRADAPVALAPATSNGGMPLLDVDGMPLERGVPAPIERMHSSRTRHRGLLKMGLVLMVVLLALQALYLSPFTDPAAGQPPRKPAAIPLAEVQPFGVNTFLHKEVDRWKKVKTVEMARDMGAGWIKQQFPWAEIEYRQDPQRPYWDVKNNQNAWDKFDGIVDLAEQNGLRVIARIDSAPAWARSNDPNLIKKLIADGLDPAKAPPVIDHMDDFANFVEAFVRRYSGRVAAIQVWNEPNLKAEWATGRPVNSAEYATLLQVAYKAANKADPNMIVLAAPLATNNESLGYAGNLNELDYLQGLYDAGARPYFDALAANAYGTTYAPEDPPSRQKLNFRRVELLRDVMVKNGDENKAVWFNEYGWNASPANIQQLPWGRVSPEQQGDYTVRGIEYAREHWPWAGVFTIWYLRQVGDVPRGQSDYYFGLVDPDFVPGSAYSAVQEATRQFEKVATPGEWGPLSPPVDAGPEWRIHGSLAVPGGIYVSPAQDGDTLEIPFTGTDVKLMLVPPANSVPLTGTNATGRYYVTVDGTGRQVSPDLPRDGSDLPYIDLPAGGQATEVVVVRGLDAELRTGQHTLRVRFAVSAGANQAGADASHFVGAHTYAPQAQPADIPGVGTVTVEVHRSYFLFILLTLALAAGIVFTAWVLRRSRPLPEVAHRGG